MGNALYLKAGTKLDHETAPQLDVTVSLDGTTLTADHRLVVDNRNDTPLRLDKTAAVDVPEGTRDTGHKVAALVQDTAGQAVTYAITGGADGHLFEVDAVAGTLSFRAAPDHDRPGDKDGDNVYEVTVTATSASKVAGDTPQSASRRCG